MNATKAVWIEYLTVTNKTALTQSCLQSNISNINISLPRQDSTFFYIFDIDVEENSQK